MSLHVFAYQLDLGIYQDAKVGGDHEISSIEDTQIGIKNRDDRSSKMVCQRRRAYRSKRFSPTHH